MHSPRHIRPSLLLAVLLLVLGAAACKIKYGFRQGQLDPNLKTISIDRFENTSAIVVPLLSQQFTQALQDRFLSQTNLKLVQYDGDIQLTGAIAGYQVDPVAIQGNEQAGQNRLTMTVQVNYGNLRTPDKNWQNTFRQFADFPSTQSLSDVQTGLNEDLVNRLTQDILNKVLSDW